jgi:hypothetical protein
MVWGLLTRTLNCIVQHDPKFKSLGLFDSLSKKRAGAQMNRDNCIGGVCFHDGHAAATLYERRMDVLHGPDIQGRGERRLILPLERMQKLIRSATDRLRWKLRPVIHLASIIAC